ARVGPAHRARIRAPALVAHRGAAAFGEPFRLRANRGRDAILSEPIEARLRAAGLPALPRTAWLEIDLDRIAANAITARGALPVQLEVETGLGRGGLDPGDLAPIVARIRSTPGVELTGVWSHLVAPEDADRSAGQADVFARAVEAVGGALRRPGPPIPRGESARRGGPVGHLAATGGLLAATVPAWDSVRLGLGLYGIVPDRLVAAPERADAATALRPAMSLHARPVRVADLPAGHAISYGPSYETGRPSRIATLPLGYRDGWPRCAPNRAPALAR